MLSKQLFCQLFICMSFNTLWMDGKGHLASLVLHLHNHSKEERKKERGEQQRRQRLAVQHGDCMLNAATMRRTRRLAVLSCADIATPHACACCWAASARTQRAATCPRARGLQRHQIQPFLFTCKMFLLKKFLPFETSCLNYHGYLGEPFFNVSHVPIEVSIVVVTIFSILWVAKHAKMGSI